MIDDYNFDEDSLLDKEIEEHNRSNALNRRLAGSSSNKVGLSGSYQFYRHLHW